MMLVVIYPLAPHSSSDFHLFLMALTFLRSIGQASCRMPFYRNLSDIFLMTRLRKIFIGAFFL